jgi:murein DD-endopeptidase MepM/ murein hydrolase activator NlpD
MKKLINNDRNEFKLVELLIGVSCLVLAGQLWGNTDLILGHKSQRQNPDTNEVKNTNEKAILPLARMEHPGRESTSYGWRTNTVTGKRQFHDGHDVKAPQGTPILSIFSGVVETTGFIGACGNTVEIRSGKYLATYCHIMPNGILVREGQQVKQGDVIAKVGTTGRSTGPHLHIGIKVNGQNVNPLTVLPGWF